MMPSGFQYIEDFLSDDSFCDWVASGQPIIDPHWGRFLQDYPAQELTFRRAIAISQQLAQHQTQVNSSTDAAWAQLQSALPSTNKQTLVRRLRPWMAAAASVLFLCMLSIWLWPDSQHFATGFGEKQEVELPDGTRVTLQANSQVWWEGKWDELNPRQVFLSGEAYFSVTSAAANEGKAFLVQASPLEIMVLGTEFNLVNRPQRQQLTLVEGKVELKAPDGAAHIIAPHEHFQWDPNTQKGKKETVNTQLFTDWQKDTWHFQNATLAEVALRIEEHFGRTVHFTEAYLKDRTLSGAIPAAKLSIVIEALASVLNVEITQESAQLIISTQVPE